MSSRNWCFTINNPTTEDVTELLCPTTTVKFLFASLETGSEDTLHYQGYLELDRHRRLNHVKNILTRAHLEPRRGSAKQALSYCLKDLTPETKETIANWEQESYIGDLHDTTRLPTTILRNTAERTASAILSDDSSRKRGREERLLALKKKIDEGATDKELAEEDFASFIQYHRGLRIYRLVNSKPRNHPVETIVIIGPTGTGKSKWCMDNYPDAYWKQRSAWWDNYTGQETVIIDEFYGWLPYDLLLRLCDRYPLLVETKGSNVQFVAKRIIITSNHVPDRWYKAVYFDAFIRRVTTWGVFPAWGETVFTDDYTLARRDMDSCDSHFAG